jgi:DNA polymerase-3 subunit delta
MQLRAEQLHNHLAKSLAALYAIHGDEPLLALEAADAVRATARKQGFSERAVLEPGRHFDWSEFTHAAASLSLFAEKKLIELRLAGGKPGLQGAAAIADYCGRPSADIVLLLSVPRLDRNTQNSDWFRALAQAGVVVDIYPVERQRLPAWIAERLARQRQSAPREVLEFLADRVEGNLLAAHQEVQKLALLAPEGELHMETVNEAVASVARYDPYVAAEALLAQGPERYVRVIEGLRAEGEQPTFVLFVLSSVLFVLHGLARGGVADGLFMQHRLFNRPLQRAVQAAARRYPAPLLARAIAHAAAIDRAIKGVGRGEPWEEFITLGLKLAHGSKA